MSSVTDLVAEDQPRPTSDDLEEITRLARDAKRLEMDIKELRSRLEGLEAQRDAIVRRRLPEKMDRIGLSQITVEPFGNVPRFSVTVATMYQCNIAAGWAPERREKAFRWLEDNGHASLIKTQVTTVFARESQDEVRRLVTFLEENRDDFSVKESVNPMTMKAWYKEMCQAGHVPSDVLGGYIERRAEIKDE